MKDKDKRLPEELASIFSKETLNKLGLTESNIELYTKKMKNIMEAATKVSYRGATLLCSPYKKVILEQFVINASCFYLITVAF